MADNSDPAQRDIEALKSSALEILARIEGNSGGALRLPEGVNDIYIEMRSGDTALVVEISSARKIHRPPFRRVWSRPGKGPGPGP